MPIGSKGSGAALFEDIPKDARNLRFSIRDAATKEEYGEAKPICANNSMSVVPQLIVGPSTDKLKVDYTLTSDGASNPSEEHEVIVSADWDRESDLEAVKTVLGGIDDVDAEEEVTIALTVRNQGPAPTNGIVLKDQGLAFSSKQFEVLGIEQVAGPKATVAPRLFTDEGNETKAIVGQWGVVQPGDEVRVLVHIRVKKGMKKVGDLLTVQHRSDAKRVEPAKDPHANESFLLFGVRSAPDSKISSASAAGAAGTSSPAGPQGPALEVMRPGLGIEPLRRATVKKVQVAILRLGGGKALQGGLPEEPTKKPGGCKWLAGRSGTKFKGRARAANGYCDSPVWLDAAGTTRWSLDLAHSLPFGKYVVYSRAVGADGVAERIFTAKDGNRKQIFLR